LMSIHVKPKVKEVIVPYNLQFLATSTIKVYIISIIFNQIYNRYNQFFGKAFPSLNSFICTCQLHTIKTSLYIAPCIYKASKRKMPLDDYHRIILSVWHAV
jgi:hypothetical protein